jgi:hypothetical protein
MGAKVATRKAFGESLAAVGARSDVVALDGEMDNSTHADMGVPLPKPASRPASSTPIGNSVALLGLALLAMATTAATRHRLGHDDAHLPALTHDYTRAFVVIAAVCAISALSGCLLRLGRWAVARICRVRVTAQICSRIASGPGVHTWGDDGEVGTIREAAPAPVGKPK